MALYIVCRERSAAARRCACFWFIIKISMAYDLSSYDFSPCYYDGNDEVHFYGSILFQSISGGPMQED